MNYIYALLIIKKGNMKGIFECSQREKEIRIALHFAKDKLYFAKNPGDSQAAEKEVERLESELADVRNGRIK